MKFASRFRFAIFSVLLCIVLGASVTYFRMEWRKTHAIGFDRQAYFDCLPWDVFIIDFVTAGDTISRFELVTWVTKGLSPRFDDGSRFIKYAAAIPGDEVTIRSDQIFINNEYWGELTLHHKLNAKPGEFDKTYRLKAQEYFVLGTTPSSFDSRYFGPITRDQITGRAHAIF